MSTDWRLNISDCLENELISAIELKTMMIERETTGMGLFKVSMDLKPIDLNLLNINDRKFYNLNYYSNSYPLNTFILKDAILTSITCEHNSRNNNMHVEASWNYYRESDDFEYVSDSYDLSSLETAYVDMHYNYDVHHVDMRYVHTDTCYYAQDLEEKFNWKSFGF